MDTYIRDRQITSRTRHECRVCGDIIKAGETCQSYTGVGDYGFYTIYSHTDCWEHSRNWHDDDWDSHTPGTISREEIVRL